MGDRGPPSFATFLVLCKNEVCVQSHVAFHRNILMIQQHAVLSTSAIRRIPIRVLFPKLVGEVVILPVRVELCPPSLREMSRVHSRQKSAMSLKVDKRESTVHVVRHIIVFRSSDGVGVVASASPGRSPPRCKTSQKIRCAGRNKSVRVEQAVRNLHESGPCLARPCVVVRGNTSSSPSHVFLHSSSMTRRLMRGKFSESGSNFNKVLRVLRMLKRVRRLLTMVVGPRRTRGRQRGRGRRRGRRRGRGRRRRSVVVDCDYGR